MSLIRHIFIALAYSLIAAACALALPSLWPGAGEGVAVIIGAMVLLGGALLHEVSTRQDQHAVLAEELHDLRMSFGNVTAELERARQEVALIGEALKGGGGKKSSRALERDVHDVVAEVKVLQSLVDQLSGDGGKAKRPARRDEAPLILAEPMDGSRSIAVVADGLSDDDILSLIRDGLKRDRVDLVFQPIVSLPQRKRRYYEAFSRIRAEDDTVIVPDQYIALAEREGLITAIDNMLLFRCVQLLRQAQSKSSNVGFFLNISPYTLADTKFFTDFVEFMGENQQLSSNLVFEFAQPTIANGDDDVLRQLDRLSILGFRFSMDQVTSLRLDYDSLIDRHFKFIKIDAQTLLSRVEPADGQMDIKQLKRALDRSGIDLIVEKIESEPMLLELLDFQIDFGQGYLFGEPRRGRGG